MVIDKKTKAPRFPGAFLFVQTKGESLILNTPNNFGLEIFLKQFMPQK
jgi:hypothetical protein